MERKRQVFLFEAYYKNYQQFFISQLLPVHKQNLIDNQGNPAWMADVYATYAFDLFNYWQLRYTGGESIVVLRQEIDQVMDLYEKKALFEREAKADPTYPAFDLAYLDDYVRYVGLLSLAILLHREDLIPRLHGLIVGSEYDQDDALVEELLSRYLPGRPYLDTFYHDEPYEPLLDATAGDTAEERLADLKTYLKKWYGGMKGTGWYNAHKGMTDEGGGGYDGYWAWEAGAIAYLHGIDDTTIDSMYYPKDLVAYARAGGPPPADTQLA
nr:PoNe immunity protein domain-containing protein [Chitinivorax tropicus]